MVFGVISAAGTAVEQPVYVVGGYVRDFYLSRTKDADELDIDFVTVGLGITLAKEIAEGLGPITYRSLNSLVRLISATTNIDLGFVGARKESYNRNSRKAAVGDGTLEDDQLRHDFTS